MKPVRRQCSWPQSLDNLPFIGDGVRVEQAMPVEEPCKCLKIIILLCVQSTMAGRVT